MNARGASLSSEQRTHGKKTVAGSSVVRQSIYLTTLHQMGAVLADDDSE